jgi:hypothetical protein
MVATQSTHLHPVGHLRWKILQSASVLNILLSLGVVAVVMAVVAPAVCVLVQFH